MNLRAQKWALKTMLRASMDQIGEDEQTRLREEREKSRGMNISLSKKGKISPAHRAVIDSLRGKPLSPEHIAAIKKSKENISEETREKIRLSRKGQKASPETRKLLSDLRMGRKLSEETKAKISAKQKGVKETEETRQILRNRPQRVHSAETRAKMSAAHTGKSFTPEHRAALAENAAKRRGVKMSEETRLKMSAAKAGKPWSEKRRAAFEKSKLT